MSPPQRDSNLVVQDFLQWRKDTRRMGSADGSEELKSPFLAYTDIDDYFQAHLPQLIEAVLPKEDPSQRPEVSTVRDSYRRVFCTLLSVGKGEYIHYFTQHPSLDDHHLPFDTRPKRFPETPSDSKFWGSFSDLQWEFAALVLKYNVDFHFDSANWVIPVIAKERIGGEGNAVIYKVQVHEAYDNLTEVRRNISFVAPNRFRFRFPSQLPSTRATLPRG